MRRTPFDDLRIGRGLSQRRQTRIVGGVISIVCAVLDAGPVTAHDYRVAAIFQLLAQKAEAIRVVPYTAVNLVHVIGMEFRGQFIDTKVAHSVSKLLGYVCATGTSEVRLLRIQATCHHNFGRFMSHPKRLRASAGQTADRFESDYARQIEKPVRMETTPPSSPRTHLL